MIKKQLKPILNKDYIMSEKATSTHDNNVPEAPMNPPSLKRSSSCDTSNCDPSNCDKSECDMKSPNDDADPETVSGTKPDEGKPGQINLLKVDVTDANTALNVMVGFLGLAQKRGAFAINESAKIYECINKFS